MDIELFGDKMLDPASLEGLSNRIFQCSIIGANELRRATGKPIPRSLWLSIVFEHLFFYLTLANRITWAHTPKEERESMTARTANILLTAVVDYVFENGSEDENAARVDHFKTELAARMKEYCKFKLVIRESESEESKGTALWAFCKKVSALAGSPNDLVGMMTAHAHIHDSMMAIGIEAPKPTVPQD